MTGVVGKNTPSGDRLRGFVDRVEYVNEQIKALQEDRKLILQEAKGEGFSLPGIRYVVKARQQKPHDRQEAEAIRDLYMHSMGMDNEPPLFRQIGAMVRDAAAREDVIATLGAVVPANGEIIIKIGGTPVRLYRNSQGELVTEDYIEPDTRQAGKRSTVPQPPKKDIPAVDADGAEELGRNAAKNNVAVIDNPFPFGDARRSRWDLGWRKENGGDGMGPGDE
ncbi:MAG TPA: DUF2312 domain-containing protein [Rhizomicrobium sp.]|jgi:uncharacterized protein (UPF0335 family)|nr:DUF2312 domain-containing protein [Rhizomicrobium sp.]